MSRWHLMVFLAVVVVGASVADSAPKSQLSNLEEALGRVERQRDELRLSSEERIAGLRKQVLELQHSLDLTKDALQQAKEERDHAQKQQEIAVAANDQLQRDLSDSRRLGQERATRENTIGTALSRCETAVSACEMDVMNLKRSNDLLQSEVRQLHARDETMLNLQKEHEKKMRRWREIEASHRRQVEDFHHGDGDESTTATNAEEEDPHPEVDTPRYFSQLKLQEELYRAEVRRRKLAEDQQKGDL